MPGAGASTRPARRYAAPWWEEFERDAFRFPAARDAAEPRASSRAARATPAPAPRSPTASQPPRAASPSQSRTVTIRGHGGERNLPVERPTLRRHEEPGFRPDRAALWAVLLGLCLIVVAVVSAHG